MSRAVCVTTDPALRQTLRRAIHASGTAVEFTDSAASLDAASPPDLLVLDATARQAADIQELSARLGERTKVVVLGESLAEDRVIDLLRGAAFDHVISERSQPDEDELVVTTVKVLGGDIFGLEKYLAWGVLVRERYISTYEDKRASLAEVGEHARASGARRQIVTRIESVADELVMNALYDAPSIRYGVRPRVAERARAGLGPLGGEPALLRWACDGRYFALSVRDNYGELRKESILEHLARARAERGNPRPGRNDVGSGLGLYFVLAQVTRFIANICPGQATEVVCLFDLRATGRTQESCARSLHVFTTRARAS